MRFRYPVFKRFSEIIETRSVAKAGDKVFFDSFDTIEVMMEKAEGVTPEHYYVWECRANELQPEEERLVFNEVPTTIDEKFLREVVARTQILGLPELKLLWAAIVQVAMHWMIVERKPVNFGFATIFAVPYRSNWKSILLGAFPNAYRCYNRAVSKQQQALDEMGITRAFQWSELLAVQRSKDNSCQWKIETITNSVWDRATEAAERKRVAWGRAAYAKWIGKTLQRQRRLAAAAFGRFICGSAIPSGQVLDAPGSGGQIIIPFTPKGGITPKAAWSSFTGIMCDVSDTDEKPLITSAIEREVAEMSRMPDLQSQPFKLRISGGNVERSD